MAGLLTIETSAGRPIQLRGARLVPFSQAVRLRLPFARGGLTWNRPVSVLVIQPDGSEKVLPVPDPTRLLVWALLGSAFLAWLVMVIDPKGLRDL